MNAARRPPTTFTGRRGRVNPAPTGHAATVDASSPAHLNRQSPIPMEEEHFFTCPYCWQTISMLLDLSVDGQQYIEDCEVCCRPIEITYVVEDEAIASFEAEPIQDA